MKSITQSIAIACATVAAGFLAAPLDAEACTRFVYHGAQGEVMTARSMDYTVDVDTNLWVFPRGMKREGAAGAHSIKWTSRYGSVIAGAYDFATTDGMNEAGLVANLLWLTESEYPTQSHGKPGLSMAAWAQYVLDNYATVDEAVRHLRKEPFVLISENAPGEARLATLHLSISDPTGDSAIIEYVGGKQVISHSRDYQVMTNSPIYEKQLAINEYWQQIGGLTMLPGTNRASDRFARASFYVNAIPKSPNQLESTASVISVIRNASVPYGISTPNKPDIASTRWRTVSDQTRGLYYFESAMAPNTFWVNVKQLDFSPETGKVMRLALGKNESNVFAGEVNQHFKETPAFAFLPVKPLPR